MTYDITDQQLFANLRSASEKSAQYHGIPHKCKDAFGLVAAAVAIYDRLNDGADHPALQSVSSIILNALNTNILYAKSQNHGHMVDEEKIERSIGRIFGFTLHHISSDHAAEEGQLLDDCDEDWSISAPYNGPG